MVNFLVTIQHKLSNLTNRQQQLSHTNTRYSVSSNV